MHRNIGLADRELSAMFFEEVKRSGASHDEK
jgi:hypothetical protein